MKPLIVSLIFILGVQFASAQKEVMHDFGYSSTQLEKVLADIEQKFNIKYSYADSIVAPKQITLPEKSYSLQLINSEIEKQTYLSIVKIDERYYSIHQETRKQIEYLKEVSVVGFLSKGITKTSEKVIILPQKVEELPGVTDADILFSLQQLPGVKSPNETASGLHIRGGTPDQNLILWDGIRLYHPGHLFGMISAFNPNIEQTVNYYNKAVNPKFGERISSVIDIKSTDKIADSLRFDAGINALNADMYVRMPLAKNKLGVQLAARKSFTEWMQTPTFNSLAEKVFQNTSFRDFDKNNKFQFQDYSAKLNFNPSENTSLSLTGIFIDNYLDYSSRVPTGPRSQKMDIENYGYSLNWNQKYNSKLSHKILFYYSSYAFNYQRNLQYSPAEFDRFTKLNRITDSGVEVNFNYQRNREFSVEYGYQLFGNDISHSFTSKTENLEINLDQKHFYSITHAGYVFGKYSLSGWTFQGGTRYNYYRDIDAESFEPRLFLQKKFTERFTGHISYEKKSQIMSQVRESVANDLSLENYVWILADDKAYPIQRANQITAGFIYDSHSWLFDFDAYYKTIQGVTSLSFGFLHQFDSSVRQGDGFTKGFDILIQKSAPSWRAWITYTYQDSQNKYDGINSGKYFPINADTKHALNLSFFKKWKNYSASAGWFWHSGRPYSALNASGGIVSLNNERLPYYQRLDISAAYQFHNKNSWSGRVGVSVFNCLNQHTIISKEYERQYSEIGDFLTSAYTVRDYYSLGITPNVFLKVSF